MLEVHKMDIELNSYELPNDSKEVSFIEHSGRYQLVTPGVSIDPRDSNGFTQHDYTVYDMNIGHKMILKPQTQMTIAEMVIMAINDYHQRLALECPINDRIVERVVDNVFGIEMPPEPPQEVTGPKKKSFFKVLWPFAK